MRNKALVTRNIFAHNIEIKRYYDTFTWVPIPTKVTSKKRDVPFVVFLRACLGWNKNLSKIIAIYFYRYIVCENIVCDKGLKRMSLCQFHQHFTSTFLPILLSPQKLKPIQPYKKLLYEKAARKKLVKLTPGNSA